MPADIQMFLPTDAAKIEKKQSLPNIMKEMWSQTKNK